MPQPRLAPGFLDSHDYTSRRAFTALNYASLPRLL